MNRRPEGGPGNLPTRLILKFLIKIPMPFGAFWMTSFLSFLSNLYAVPYFFIFLYLYRRINYSCLGASASISSFSFAPKVGGGGEGTIPKANLGGVLLNSSNYLTSRHARKMIVDTGYYRRWIGYLWSVFFLSYGLRACEKRNRKIDD